MEVAPQFQAHRASIAPTTLSDEMKNFLKNVVPGSGPGGSGGAGAAGGHDVGALLAASNLSAASMTHADAAAAASRLAEASKHQKGGSSSKKGGKKKAGKVQGVSGNGEDEAASQPPPQFQPHRASVCEASLSPDMQSAIREALAASAALLAAGAAGANATDSAVAKRN
jgi:hypothetical protein